MNKDIVKLCPYCSKPMDISASTVSRNDGLISVTHSCTQMDCKGFSETIQFKDEPTDSDEALWCWWTMRSL